MKKNRPVCVQRTGRRSIRLQGYDYAQAGAYYITICVRKRECLFGEIVDGEMRLNDAGRMVQKCWDDIPVHFPHVELDEFVVMPNHVHGIVLIINTVAANATVDANATVGPNIDVVRAKNFSPQQQPRGTSKTIGSIIRGFKIGVTKWMRQNTVIHNVWQRNYYEHIIRDKDDLDRIREYILRNPAQWESDQENPSMTANTDVVRAKFFLPLPTQQPHGKSKPGKIDIRDEVIQ